MQADNKKNLQVEQVLFKTKKLPKKIGSLTFLINETQYSYITSN